MLSANQVELLTRIRDAQRPVSLTEIAAWSLDGSAYEYGEHAARNAMKRMDDRGLVAGSGAGRMRSFVLTSMGDAALAEHLPPPVDRDSNFTSPLRTYVVLEAIELARLDSLPSDAEVFVRVADVEARNTTHALREAGAIIGRTADQDVDPVLIPVAERMFQRETVKVRTRTTVGIG